jgi:acetolactate synthase regulatory subunit
MTRRFSLLVDDRPETLLRVTGLCLRRRADVVALHYGRSRTCLAADGSSPASPRGWARLDMELAVDERHGRGLAERLGALVEVRDVAELRG